MGYGGERLQYSPDWRGPLKNRSCTDWPCLIIFVVFMAVWVAIGSYAFINGDISRYLIPTDSQGRKCGTDAEVSSKPYLYFFDPSQCINKNLKCETPQVCRSECPSSYWSNKVINFFPLNETRRNIVCEPEINVWNKTREDLNDLVEQKKCAEFTLNSTSIFKRCIPYPVPKEFLVLINITMDISQEQMKQLEAITKAADYVMQVIETIIDTKQVILQLVVLGALICLIYIFLLRWLALPFVILSILVLITFFGFLTYISYDFYSTKNDNVWLIATIILGIITGLIVLTVLCLLKRIRLACQLIKEASKAVLSILSTLLFPIFPWLMHLAAIVYLVAVGIHLYTIEFEESWKIKLLGAIHIIGFIWFYCFITALGEMILAGTFATWYWTFRKADVPFFTLVRGTWRTVRYHLGTVAFGSLLITICRIIRYVLEWMIHIGRKEGGFVSTVAGSICASCTRVFMAFIEQFLKFMNHNAYIVCAIYGKGLCASASDALNLLMRNVVRVVVLNNIVSWLLFVGKLAISVGMAAIAYWYCTKREHIDYWWIPVALVAVGAYLVANIFFSVYESAVDTIFLCFLEDCERHDGSMSKPYYMSWQLRKLLHKNH